MALEKFTYTYGKQKVVLPKFGQLPFGIIRKIRKEDVAEQFFLMFELLLKDDPATLEIIDSMPNEDVNDLVTKWQKDSGISVGESDPS